MALEQRERRHRIEILELQDAAGEHALRGRDELVDERIPCVEGHAGRARADVAGIVSQRLVVGADVERDGQAQLRPQPSAGGVEDEFADRDAHAVRPEVAEPQDASAVGHDDDAHLAPGPVGEQLRNASAMLDRQVEPARPRIDAAPLEAGLADGRRVDDRQQLLEMVEQHPVEQRLVLALQRSEVQVLVECGRLRAQARGYAVSLLGQRFDARRKQSFDAELRALLAGERGSPVEQRIRQHLHAGATVDLRRYRQRHERDRQSGCDARVGWPACSPSADASTTGRVDLDLINPDSAWRTTRTSIAADQADGGFDTVDRVSGRRCEGECVA